MRSDGARRLRSLLATSAISLCCTYLRPSAKAPSERSLTPFLKRSRVPYLKRKKRNPYRITLLSVCPSVRPSVKTLFLRNARRRVSGGGTISVSCGAAARRRKTNVLGSRHAAHSMSKHTKRILGYDLLERARH
ncbi:hypothetical protein EVAR_9139_1 [Eumeta japonica]|uniref:Uncharacterized protein n=1 Tax=Eumeta variegata TaxID=151549 RepID=A0A4C1TW69_EUMVA|nr:hypothetical protein EVAR_9139_1 [Eumeta japonica]